MAYLSSEVVRVVKARIRAKREIRILALATRRALDRLKILEQKRDCSQSILLHVKQIRSHKITKRACNEKCCKVNICLKRESLSKQTILP